jgi:hypothetical protein
MEIMIVCVNFLKDELYCSNVVEAMIKYVQLESIALLELAIWSLIGQRKDHKKNCSSTKKGRNNACTTCNSTVTLQHSMSKSGSQVIIPLVLQFLDTQSSWLVEALLQCFDLNCIANIAST